VADSVKGSGHTAAGAFQPGQLVKQAKADPCPLPEPGCDEYRTQDGDA